MKQTQSDELKRKERFMSELLYDMEELSRREGELKRGVQTNGDKDTKRAR